MSVSNSNQNGDTLSEKYKLPNGMAIYHLNQFETDILYGEVFISQDYLKHGISLSPGCCVFDIGANIGLFTLYVTSQIAGSKVFAFDPAPPVFEILAKNCADIQDRVKVFPYGVSDREKQATFTFYPNLSISSSLYADEAKDRELLNTVIENRFNYQGGEKLREKILSMFLKDRFLKQEYQCQLVPLSKIIKDYQVTVIDLLKVDAEKAEQEIIQGIEPRDWAKIRQISMEVHEEEDLKRITEILRGQGFQVFDEVDRRFKNASIYNLYGVKG